MEIEYFVPACVRIGEGRRPLNEETVQRIMESIQNESIGLKTPIAVRIVDEDVPLLVSGRHRLEAVKRLGWPDIPAIVMECDERDARLWEIAENIHRAELTVLERSEQISEWIRLTEEKRAEMKSSPYASNKCAARPNALALIEEAEAAFREEALSSAAPNLHLGQVAPNESKREDGRGHRSEGGLRAAAREQGIEHRQARRSQKIASLPEEVKAAAIEAGISDNQSALLRVTNEPSAEQQLAAIQREKDLAEARRRNRAEDDYIAGSEADQFAEWLLRNSELREVPTIIAWLECAKPREIIRAMRRRTA